MSQQHNHNAPDTVGEGAQALVKTLRLGFSLLQVLLLLMLLVYAFSGFFILDENEEAIILRFGAVVGEGETAVRTSGQGHWAFPKPMDRVIRIPTSKSRTIISNHFWHQEQAASLMTDPDRPEQLPEPGPDEAGMVPLTDGYLLTADTNILHTKWQVNYLVDNPVAFYKNYEDPEAVIKATLENIVLKEVAALPIELALYQGSELRERIATDLNIAVFEKLEREIDRLDVGVDITNVNYVDKRPPRSTLAAFRKVTNADQEADKLKNDARAYANEILQGADGSRQRLIAEAQAYKSRFQASLEADADYVDVIKEKYDETGPAILLGLYTDALQNVVQRAEQQYIVHPNQEVRLKVSPKKQNPNTPERQSGRR